MGVNGAQHGHGTAPFIGYGHQSGPGPWPVALKRDLPVAFVVVNGLSTTGHLHGSRRAPGIMLARYGHHSRLGGALASWQGAFLALCSLAAVLRAAACRYI